MLVRGDMRQHRRSGEFLELARLKAVPVYERFGWVLAAARPGRTLLIGL
jgi:hypothetical protein